jgi:hypothetical protein
VLDQVERSIGFYGTYLCGQMSGFSEALDLGAVKAALEIEGIDREEWPEETKRCLLIHGEMMKIVRAKEKRGG